MASQQGEGSGLSSGALSVWKILHVLSMLAMSAFLEVNVQLNRAP